MAFSVTVFEDVKFSLSDSVIGLVNWGYIVLLSAYGRIMGTVLLFFYCSFYPWILVTVISIHFLGNYLYAKLRYAFYNAKYQYFIKDQGSQFVPIENNLTKNGTEKPFIFLDTPYLGVSKKVN